MRRKRTLRDTARFVTPAVFALLLAQPIAAQQQPPAGAPDPTSVPAIREDDGGFKVTADVQRVLLPVTVTNNEGGFAAGLRKENFRVYENGKLQEIRFFSSDDIPITIGLVIDNSGSMSHKRPETNAAALQFVRACNPKDEVFVINFNERVSKGLPEGTAFVSDHQSLRAALTSSPPAGRTALYDAINAGLTHLENGTLDKKALVVLSDGGDNASSSTLKDVIHLAERTNALIYPIGLYDEYDEDRNPRVLKKLARISGGQAFLPGKSSEIEPISRRIAAELRNQYTIGYAPSDPVGDGSFRKIRVQVVAPGSGKLSVRTREGYVASPVSGARTSRVRN